MNKIWINLLIPVCFLSTQSHAEIPNSSELIGFYVGAMGGYGSTTWNGLVPKTNEQNLALNLSTPIEAREGGGVWGVFVGYEFNPTFSLETNYIRYANSTICFDELSFFAFDRDGQIEFTSRTETLNIIAKIMLPFPYSNVRIYSGVGLGGVHRQDMVLHRWHTGPSFSVGFTWPVTDRVRFDLDGNYTAGFGEARLSPTDSYIPFVYSGGARLAFLF